MMLKNGLIRLTMMNMIKDCFEQVKTRKKIGFFKDELAGKIMTEFVGLRPKTYAYLKMMIMKRKKLKEQKNA